MNQTRMFEVRTPPWMARCRDGGKGPLKEVGVSELIKVATVFVLPYNENLGVYNVKRIWSMPQSFGRTSEILRESLGISPVVADILAQRGFRRA